MNRYFIIIAAISLYSITACKSSVLPLSQAEKDFINSLSQKYECKANMQHDFEAIGANKTDGSLSIGLENDTKNGICTKDSTLLKAIAMDIAREAVKIISYKQHYNTIKIDFNITIATGENSYHTICNKDVQIDFPGLSKAVMIWYNVYIPPPGRDEPY